MTAPVAVRRLKGPLSMSSNRGSIAFLSIGAVALLWYGTGCVSCPEPAMEGALLPAPSESVSTLYEPQSELSIEVEELEIIDEQRSRRIPIRVLLPSRGERFPVVLFSPGLGASDESYSYLTSHWARHGYAVVQIRHVDSDDSLNWIQLWRAAYDRQVWRDRPRDISAVLDALEDQRSLLGSLSDRVDLDRVAAAGHSYGAYTSLVVAGGLLAEKDGEPVSLKDDRIDALVALSPPKNRGYSEKPAYDPIDVPVLHMTGTADRIIAFRSYPCHRRLAFEKIIGEPQYMVTIQGAKHGSFSAGPDGRENLDSRVHTVTKATTLAFFDAWLSADSSARAWLSRIEFRDAIVERKN